MKKENIEIVEKPYLKGSWYGKDALKLIPKKFFGMLGIVLLYFLGGLLLNLGSLFGTILPMTCLVVVVAGYQFNKGQDHGASDVAFGEILYGQQEQGNHHHQGRGGSQQEVLPAVVLKNAEEWNDRRAHAHQLNGVS